MIQNLDTRKFAVITNKRDFFASCGGGCTHEIKIASSNKRRGSVAKRKQLKNMIEKTFWKQNENKINLL